MSHNKGSTVDRTLDVELAGEERETGACWAERRVDEWFAGGEDKSKGRSTGNVAKDHCQRGLTTGDDGCRPIDDDGRCNRGSSELSITASGHAKATLSHLSSGFSDLSRDLSHSTPISKTRKSLRRKVIAQDKTMVCSNVHRADMLAS